MIILKETVQKQSSKQWLPKVSLNKKSPEVHRRTLDTPLDQISDHKHDIYLSGKLSTKFLTQVVNKNIKFKFTKLDRFLSLTVRNILEHYRRLKRQLFRNLLYDSEHLLLIIKLIGIGHLFPSLLNHKHNVEWFLLRCFLYLPRA